MAHRYCYRELEAALPGLTAQRGTEDGQMDTAGLEERSSGSREREREHNYFNGRRTKL